MIGRMSLSGSLSSPKQQEPANITSLKADNRVIFDSKSKAVAFNTQFSSAFTREDTTNIPNLGESSLPTMNHINCYLWWSSKPSDIPQC